MEPNSSTNIITNADGRQLIVTDYDDTENVTSHVFYSYDESGNNIGRLVVDANHQ